MTQAVQESAKFVASETEDMSSMFVALVGTADVVFLMPYCVCVAKEASSMYVAKVA